MNVRNLVAGAIAGAWIILAAGCGGSSSSGDDAPAPATNHAVGGKVYGLLGTLVLENNGGDPLTLTADGTFAFSKTLPEGSTYSVMVRNDPANQICTVVNYTGKVSAASATSITVNCSSLPRLVSGNVYGLAPSESVVLQNNGIDDLTLDNNGFFTFSRSVAQGGAYDVSVLTQPATQTCTVNNGNGTAGATHIEDVEVTCSINAHTVGGTVSGLNGTVVLQNNGADDLTLSSSVPFTFPAPVAEGATYNVTVASQPASQTCIVTNGSGTMGSSNVANTDLTCTDNTTTLSASVADLALSVTGLTEYGVSVTPPSSGVPRNITVTNTGSYAATNVSMNATTLPAGTVISPNTCNGVLAAGDSCNITVTPGATPTSDGMNPCSVGTAPVPTTIQVQSDNASTVSSNVVVLSYGCIYQGGYVYAFDDTTPDTLSVGGKVVATSDQSSPAGIIWSSDGSGSTSGSAVFDAIFGISEISTSGSPNPIGGSVSGQTGCEGTVDGACNTNNLYVYYQNNAANAPININSYAAGVCKQTISGYSDWYLPAVCELGYGAIGCGNAGTPALQNVLSNIYPINTLNSPPSGIYWSSTEASNFPDQNASIQFFDPSPFQAFQIKSTMAGVRCSRALSL